jgi:hypothetical protein
MNASEHIIAIKLLRALSGRPRLSSRRSLDKWIRETLDFDLLYCKYCDKFKRPQFFYSSERARCKRCTCLYKMLQYWKNPEKHREVAKKSRDKKPPRPFPKELTWKTTYEPSRSKK